MGNGLCVGYVDGDKAPLTTWADFLQFCQRCSAGYTVWAALVYRSRSQGFLFLVCCGCGCGGDTGVFKGDVEEVDWLSAGEEFVGESGEEGAIETA